MEQPFKKYTVNSEDLTANQIKIIKRFSDKCGRRAEKKDSYKSIIVGFHKGECFHVAFNE